MVRISVVIPTFNRAEVLGRAVESALGQTRAAEEVIVVDDGSADGTAEMVRERWPEVALVRQENRGVSAARNAGVARATGDWVAFLDSDDAWLPGKLEAQERRIREVEAAGNARVGSGNGEGGEAEGAGGEVVLCHTEEVWIRRGRRVNPKKKHAKREGDIFEQCLGLCAISPSAALVRRDALEAVGGFDESLPACEDYDLWLRMCARWPVVLVGEALVVKYGGHADQLSRRFWGMDRFRVRALEKLLAGGGLSEAQERSAAAMLARKARILAAGAEKRGKLEEAAGYREKARVWKRGARSPMQKEFVT